MSALHRYSIRHPWQVLLWAALSVLAAAPGMGRLRLRTDGHALVPPSAPEVTEDARLRKAFGLRDMIIVLIRREAPEGIFNPHTLGLVADLTRSFAGIEGLSPTALSSLWTERSHRVRPGTLEFLPYLHQIPQTPAELDQLRDDLRKMRIYSGTLVSFDEKAAAIYIDVPPGVDRTLLYQRVRKIIDERADGPEEVHVTGAPVAESLLGTQILEDLGVPEWVLGARVGRPMRGDDPHADGALDRLRRFIGRHVGLLPVALAVMACVFLVCFRSPAAAALTLAKVGACIVSVLGLLGWCGVPLYLTIAVMPIVLTTTGVADEIHIFTRFARELRRDPTVGSELAAVVTMEEWWRAVFKTSVTTAIGFFSFAISPLVPAQAFGVFTGIGVIYCMFWALTVTPATLVILPGRWFARPSARRTATAGGRDGVAPLEYGADSRLARLGGALVRRRGLVLAASAAVLAVCSLGIRRVRVQDSWIGGFSPTSEFYRATQMFNEQFLGMHVLHVCVDTGGRTLTTQIGAADVDHLAVKLPGSIVSDVAVLRGRIIELSVPAATTQSTREQHLRHPPYASVIQSAAREKDRIVVGLDRPRGSAKFILRLSGDEQVAVRISPQRFLSPEVLGLVGELEEFIAARRAEKVGGVLGPAIYARTTNYIVQGLNEAARRLPATQEAAYWVWKRYEMVRGSHRLRALIDSENNRGVISVFMKHANYVDTQRLMDAIRDYERTRLAPHRLSLSFAGDVAVSQALIGAIVDNQVRSLLGSIFGVLLVATLLGRSLRWGLYCVVPCAVAIPVSFAVMGWGGIPLGVATSMFTAMTIGIGDDYAIHFVERVRLAAARAAGRTPAMQEAMGASGRPIIVDALGVAAGFGVLTLSQVPPNARLGLMVLMSVIICLAATLLLLPALIRPVPARDLVMVGAVTR